MTLQQLAGQTDAHAFQLLYHDPRIHTAHIAAEFGIRQSRVSEFAHLLGVPTRREMGLQYKPTLLTRRKAWSSKLIGRRGCTGCPMLARCKRDRLWLDKLPCEVELDWEKGIEYDADSSPTMGRVPMVARVVVEAMG